MLLLPLATALLLALLPERLRTGALRPALRIAGTMAALLLALAVILVGAAAGTPWLGRSAALFTVLLAYALAAAAATADEPPHPGAPSRRREATMLAIPAVVAFAALAASPLATVALSQLALLPLADAERHGWARFASRQSLLAATACQAVALLGAALLGAAPAAGGLLLGLGFAGLGLVAPGLRPVGRTVVELAAGGGLVALALAVLLRLRVAGDLPPVMLLWAGIAWLLAVALELWRLPPGDAGMANSAALALCGAAVAGLGIGGAASVTSLLLLAASLLAATASALAQELAPGHMLRPLAVAVLALLPPFGVFASALLLLVEAVRAAPLAALPLAFGLALVCLRLASSRPTPMPAGDRPARPWPVAILLLGNLLIGLALPPACLAWLARAASPGG